MAYLKDRITVSYRDEARPLDRDGCKGVIDLRVAIPPATFGVVVNTVTVAICDYTESTIMRAGPPIYSGLDKRTRFRLPLERFADSLIPESFTRMFQQDLLPAERADMAALLRERMAQAIYLLQQLEGV